MRDKITKLHDKLSGNGSDHLMLIKLEDKVVVAGHGSIVEIANLITNWALRSDEAMDILKAAYKTAKAAKKGKIKNPIEEEKAEDAADTEHLEELLEMIKKAVSDGTATVIQKEIKH